MRLLLGGYPPPSGGVGRPDSAPPPYLIPEVLDKLHEVLHGLYDLRDSEIVQNLFTVTTQLSEELRVSINIKNSSLIYIFVIYS